MLTGCMQRAGLRFTLWNKCLKFQEVREKGLGGGLRRLSFQDAQPRPTAALLLFTYFAPCRCLG